MRRRRQGQRARFATVMLAALGLPWGSAGCARQLDMGQARDGSRPRVLIPYTAVHEETRLYPDYGPIGASIVTGDGASAPIRKKGKSP